MHVAGNKMKTQHNASSAQKKGQIPLKTSIGSTLAMEAIIKTGIPRGGVRPPIAIKRTRTMQSMSDYRRIKELTYPDISKDLKLL